VAVAHHHYRRVVRIVPVLRDELLAYSAREPRPHDATAFATSTGRRHSPSNVRRRLLERAVTGANKALAKLGSEPIPAGLTPHSPRRTFASILFAIAETPPSVMAQMGHTTANLTLAR
jgi:integrase